MKSTKFSITAAILLFVGSIVLLAQPDPSTIKTAEIKSTNLNELRTITISLPNDYTTTDNRYPVLYLLDGRTHFRHATGAADFLSNQGSVPNMIVVSVHNVDRSRDFSPIHDETIPTSGGGEKFLDFVSDELTAFVDDQYRTSGFNILMGHSFGGTFVVYSLLAKPDLFDGYIAISPFLQFADNYLVNKASEELKSFGENKKYFYMTIGDEPAFYEPLAEFSSAVNERTGGSIEFDYVKMESENHGTIPYLTVFNGLKFIFSDWPLPPEKLQLGLGEVDSHYAKVSSKYGFNVQTPELVINAMGYTNLQNGDTGTAISVFKENVKRYPGSANVYDSLGEAYEGNSQFKLAEKNYQKAYDLGVKQNDFNTPIYKTNLERMQQ